jgi:hypothetical protein
LALARWLTRCPPMFSMPPMFGAGSPLHVQPASPVRGLKSNRENGGCDFPLGSHAAWPLVVPVTQPRTIICISILQIFSLQPAIHDDRCLVFYCSGSCSESAACVERLQFCRRDLNGGCFCPTHSVCANLYAILIFYFIQGCSFYHHDTTKEL